MKTRRAFLYILFLPVPLVCISAGILLKGFQKEQASRELIVAIKARDIDRTMGALQAHADPNVRDSGEGAPSLSGYLSKVWLQMRGIKPSVPTPGATALRLAVAQNSLDLVDALLAKGARDVDDEHIFVDYGSRSDVQPFPWRFCTLPETRSASPGRDPIAHGGWCNEMTGGDQEEAPV